MMKAAVRKNYCSPEGLKIMEVPIPDPRHNEILIKVKAATVSRTDCGVLTGWPLAIRLFTGLSNPQRMITGTDFAGIVVAKGDAVTEFVVGDPVYGFHDEGLATHAEYVAVPVSKSVLKKPDHISFDQAAASLEGAHYAYYFLQKFKMKEGCSVLLNGGTGAIGSAAIQFLKYYGISVVATGDTDYVDYLLSLGADEVIDYTKQDFTLLEKQFDYVFDAVGKSRFSKCKKLLKKNGVYISSELGPHWENIWLAMAAPLMPGKKVRFPIPFSIHRSMKFVQSLMEKNAFTPLIDRKYSLDNISIAFLYVQSGQKKGNVLIHFD